MPIAKHDPTDVLIVEDNVDHADLLRLQFSQARGDFAGPFRSLSEEAFDLVLLDLKLC